MAKAISLVMLETYHRLGLWHIYQNALKILIIYLRAKKPSMLILEVAYMMVSMKRSSLVLGRIYWKNMIFKKMNGCKIYLSTKKVGYGVWEKNLFCR